MWERILRKEIHENYRFFNNIEEILQEICFIEIMDGTFNIYARTLLFNGKQLNEIIFKDWL